ncbi:biotin--[acetyl-CoA-carboxylase] ligase [Butyrivibrio sp. JL13D10]|uniref:biotin--[acetyl-CoA-carboxylase] ligase n=1 Tax=Butyrivibrio sp. JL13D10 TaxID=3236815 RepID=UPI0038B6000E
MPDTKSKVLSYLEGNSGKFTSGEDIANKLNISRNSVWKAIESLRRDGFQITAASRRGYSLSGKADSISLEEIKRYLPSSINSDMIKVYDSLESTNKTAKSEASFDAPHGTVIIASRQTGGIGHNKHSFSSPVGGIYMSIVLRPEDFVIKNPDKIREFCVLSVCLAIEEATGLSANIGPTNDIFIQEKKTCGILLEASSDFDTGEVQFLIAGIGIYFNSDLSDIPSELRSTTGSLFKKDNAAITKNELIAGILQRLLSSEKVDENMLSNEYHKRLMCT